MNRALVEAGKSIKTVACVKVRLGDFFGGLGCHWISTTTVRDLADVLAMMKTAWMDRNCTRPQPREGILESDLSFQYGLPDPNRPGIALVVD